MIAWEVLEHLGWRGRVDRLKLGALDDVSIRRAFAALAKEPDSGERDYAAYLEALCRQYEDYHLGLNGTRAISLRLRPPAFREPWRFGGVQTPDPGHPGRPGRPHPRLRAAGLLQGRPASRHPVRCGADPVACAQGADLRRGRRRDDPGRRGGVVGSARRSSTRTCGARRPGCSRRTPWRGAAPSGSAGTRSTRPSSPRTSTTRATSAIRAPNPSTCRRARRATPPPVVAAVVTVLDRLRRARAGRRRARDPARPEGALRQGSGRAPRHRAAAQGARARPASRPTSSGCGNSSRRPTSPPTCPTGSTPARASSVEVGTPLGPEAVRRQRQRRARAGLARRLRQRGRAEADVVPGKAKREDGGHRPRACRP